MTAPAAATIEPARLRRAIFLRVERQDHETWRVTGGETPHRVARAADGLSCDCTDAQYGGNPCKHRLAVHLSRLNAHVLDALRLIVVPER